MPETSNTPVAAPFLLRAVNPVSVINVNTYLNNKNKELNSISVGSSWWGLLVSLPIIGSIVLVIPTLNRIFDSTIPKIIMFIFLLIPYANVVGAIILLGAIFERIGGKFLTGVVIPILIIGIPSAIVAPNVVSFRNKARIAHAVGMAAGIRATLAEYAADSASNAYPTAGSIRDYTTLRAICNQFLQDPWLLKETEEKMGIRFVSYETQDTNNDGLPDSYVLILSVPGVPGWYPGKCLRVTPYDIEKLDELGPGLWRFLFPHVGADRKRCKTGT